MLESPIGLLLLPQFTAVALASTIEPLRIANRYLRVPYRWRLLSLDGDPVPDANGVAVPVDGACWESGRLGTLIVLADVRPERFYDLRLERWLRLLDRRGATLGAIDTACFVLARAGLLNGHRVTPHWEVIDAFRERFPDSEVSPTLYAIGRRRMSSAGGSAVLDMMVSAIALDHGSAVAHRVAEHCLMERIRPAETWQRMALPLRTGAHHPRLVRALELIEQALDQGLCVKTLALSLELSERHLLRLFREHLDETPHGYLMRIRLERARGLLIQSDLAVAQVADACGFASAAHFSRVFRNRYGKSPSAMRPRPDSQRLLMDPDR